MKRKIVLLSLALIYALIFTIPHVIVKIHTPTSSVSAFDIRVADDRIYGVIYNEIKEGKFKITDSVTYEYKDVEIPFSPIPFLIIGGIAYIINSLDWALILLIAFFSFSNFLIQYCFLNNLTKNSYLSILGSFLIPISHILLTSPFRIKFFLLHYPEFDRFLWTSIPRRQIEFFFLMLPILLFYLAYIHRNKILATMSGIFIGLAFQSYVYYYAFEITGIFILLMFEYYNKNNENIKLILITVIFSLIFTVPSFIKIQNFNRYVFHSVEFLLRRGLMHSRESISIFISLFFILFLFLFLFLLIKRNKINKNVYFLTAFFFGNLILYNQHIITGIQLSTWHWLTVTGRPWMIIMFIYVLSVLIQDFNKYKLNILFIFLIMITITWSLWANMGIANNLKEYYVINQEYYKAFEWLKNNTPKYSVVLSPSFEISENIPLRTHNKVYLVNGFNSVAPDCELLYRGLLTYKLFNVSENKIDKQFNKSLPNSEGLAHFLFHVKYYPELSDELKNNLMKLYHIIEISSIDLIQFKLDYILVGPKERELGSLNPSIPLIKIYNEIGIQIYMLNLTTLANLDNNQNNTSVLLKTLCYR